MNHIWAFDHTRLDRGRSKPHQNVSGKRGEAAVTASNRSRLKDFVKGLQLRIEIAEATDDQLGRVSQLTFRTNQFNFTTIRRSENEIKDFLKLNMPIVWWFAWSIDLGIMGLSVS